MLPKLIHMKKSTISLLALVMATPLVTIAHPGHGGTDGYTIIHYFTETAHLLVLGLATLTAFALVRHLRRKRQMGK